MFNVANWEYIKIHICYLVKKKIVIEHLSINIK